MSDRTDKKSTGTYVLNVCLVLAGVLIAVMAAEGIVRVFFPHTRDHVVPAGLFKFDNDLGWKLSRNVKFVHRTRYFDVAYETNQFGFRDRQRTRERTQGTYRILFFGDSHIFGWGIERDRRFSDLMESDGGNLEILNLAVPGYGLDQQVVSYFLNGKSFDANEIVFFVSPNTLWRMDTNFLFSKYKPKFQLRPGGELDLEPIPKGKNSLLSAVYSVLSPLYLPYFIQKRMGQIRRLTDRQKRAPPPTRSRRAIPGALPFAGIGQLATAVLRKAKREAERRNQKLSIFTNLGKKLAEELWAFCRAEGISLYTTLPKGDDERFGRHDRHWNVQTNKNLALEMLGKISVR
jgi:hypothetical protein